VWRNARDRAGCAPNARSKWQFAELSLSRDSMRAVISPLQWMRAVERSAGSADRSWWTAQPQSANVPFGICNENSSEEGVIMAYDSHIRAAEFHELAAHAHRAAAVQHGKQDHFTGNEHSRQAMEHANKAHQATLEAFAQSAELAKSHSK
jgi:hypothetical protein